MLFCSVCGTFRLSSDPVSMVTTLFLLMKPYTESPLIVDKMEHMLGSYGPHPQGEAYVKDFEPEESPSGLVARTGTYNVRSRVIDDDGEVYAGESGKLLGSFAVIDSVGFLQTGSGASRSERNGERELILHVFFLVAFIPLPCIFVTPCHPCNGIHQ